MSGQFNEETLHIAIRAYDEKFVNYLLDDKHIKPTQICVLTAVYQKDFDLVKKLIEHGGEVDLSLLDADGTTLEIANYLEDKFGYKENDN